MPRNPDRWKATCIGCGTEFSPHRPKQRYHDRACAEEHRLDWANPSGGTRIPAGLGMRVCLNQDCPREGLPFRPSRASQLTCSRKCRDSMPAQRVRTREADRHPERRTRQNELRRLETAENAKRRRYLNLRNNMRRLGVEVTWEQYQDFLSRQDGNCKICRDPAANKNGHTDHDHETGRLRDLLCGNCNRGIGAFQNDPVLLRKAARYIERHRAAVSV